MNNSRKTGRVQRAGDLGTKEAQRDPRKGAAPEFQNEAVALRPDAAALRAITNPHILSPRGAVALQRAAGNQAVSCLIQAKLTVGGVGDRYEQEADRVAEMVVSSQKPEAGRQPGVQRQPEEEEVQTKPLASSITRIVQRQLEEEEVQTKPLLQRQVDEEEIQTKPLLQRQVDEEEIQTKPLLQRQVDEEEIQTKRVAQRQADGSFEAGPQVESRLAANRGGGSPLPGGVRAAMEPRFGADFGGVRVHTGSEAVRMNRDLQAQAFTHGQDIYFGPGTYNPTSESGQRLLAHELTHVIQQTGRADRIARWGGPGNTTSHDHVTEKAFESLNPKVRMWYSDEAKQYLATMSEQMDMRAGFLVLCGAGKFKQWLAKKRQKGMYKSELSDKKMRKMSFAQIKEYELQRAREYDELMGYWRASGEAPNHAEGGMYKGDGTDINLARIRQYIDAALENWTKKNPRQALASLALALHAAEDRGSHGDGRPGTGHDPRRMIPPPPLSKNKQIFHQSNPGWQEGQEPSWQGTDCDLKEKNAEGYSLAVIEAKRVLTDFAVALGLGGEEVTEQKMKAGGRLTGFEQPGKFKRGMRKFGQFFGKGAIRP